METPLMILCGLASISFWSAHPDTTRGRPQASSLFDSASALIRFWGLDPDWLVAKIWLQKFVQAKFLASTWFATKIFQSIVFGLLLNLWQILLSNF